MISISRNRLNAIVDSALGVLAALVTLAALAGWMNASGHKDQVDQIMSALTPTDPKSDLKSDPKDKSDKKTLADKHAARISSRNIFAPPKPKGLQSKLTGILGDAAIFSGNKVVRIGDTVGGASVKDVGPDWVDIEFEGKPSRLWVYGPRKDAAPPKTTPPPPDSQDSPATATTKGKE